MTPIEALKLSRGLRADPLTNANDVTLLIPEIQTLPESPLGETLSILEEFFTSEGKWEAVQTTDATPELKKSYTEWFCANLKSFKGALLKRLVSETAPCTKTTLTDVALQMVAGERVGEFNNEFFQEAMDVLITSGDNSAVLKGMCGKHGTSADLRYFAFKAIARVCHAHKRQSESISETTLQNIKTVLESLPRSLDECRDDKGDVRSLCAASEAGVAVPAATGYPTQRKRKKMLQASGAVGVKWLDSKEQQKQFSAAWNGFLALPLPSEMMLDVLEQIPTGVMPHLATPLTLSDFLTQALDRGGTCGLLALNGIFLLMTRHNLEYSEFYKRVYGLLTPEVFQWENRSKFFTLLDVFLKSGLVPAYTAAAFAKRFARLALTVSPAGALVCISFVHNLVRRHPACNVLLDRQAQPGETRLSSTEWREYDCFDPEEVDPSLSRAIESSLWESEALGNHWCHQVATHAQILLRDLTTRARNTDERIENIATVSYTTLLEQTLKDANVQLNT